MIKILSPYRFNKMEGTREFNKYHKTKIHNWEEIFGSNWMTTPLDKNLDYKMYEKWFQAKFSKLAQVIK